MLRLALVICALLLFGCSSMERYVPQNAAKTAKVGIEGQSFWGDIASLYILKDPKNCTGLEYIYKNFFPNDPGDLKDIQAGDLVTLMLVNSVHGFTPGVHVMSFIPEEGNVYIIRVSYQNDGKKGYMSYVNLYKKDEKGYVSFQPIFRKVNKNYAGGAACLDVLD